MYKQRLVMAAVLAAVFMARGPGAAALEYQRLAYIEGEDPFAGIDMPVMEFEEAALLDGGDVSIILNEERTELTVYATDRRYVPGGKPDTLRQVYTVKAHNNVVDTEKAPFYPTDKSRDEVPAIKKTQLTSKPVQFPAGTHKITNVSERTDKYGPNMIMTDAVGKVEVLRMDNDKSKVVERCGKHEDTGYAIHSNTDPMDKSKSYGCIIVSQEENKKLAATIKADKARGKSQVQTLLVKPVKEPVTDRAQLLRNQRKTKKK